MDNEFKIIYNGHEKAARRLLIETGIASVNELATMAGGEVEKIINDYYVVIKAEVDYLLIPKDKVEEFNKIIKWIER